MDNFLAALQIADSALPIGRFVHSYGLEAWLSRNPAADEAEIAAFVETFVVETAAPLDGAAVALAQRADDLTELLSTDRLVTAYKLTPPAREASRSCGRRLAALTHTLTVDPLATEFAQLVSRRETDGNLAIVHGTLARSLDLDAEAAVLIELRGAMTSLLSAAIRLGRLSPVRAQAIQLRLTPPVLRAAREALTLTPDELRSSGPETEIHALLHQWTDPRIFST